MIRARSAGRELRPFLVPLVVGLCARWLYVYATVDLRLLHDNLGYLLRGQYLVSHHVLMPIIAHHRSYPDAYWPPFFPIVLAALIKLHSFAVALWFGRHLRIVIWLRLAMSTINAVSLAGLTLIAYRVGGSTDRSAGELDRSAVSPVDRRRRVALFGVLADSARDRHMCGNARIPANRPAAPAGLGGAPRWAGDADPRERRCLDSDRLRGGLGARARAGSTA